MYEECVARLNAATVEITFAWFVIVLLIVLILAALVLGPPSKPGAGAGSHPREGVRDQPGRLPGTEESYAPDDDDPGDAGGPVRYRDGVAEPGQSEDVATPPEGGLVVGYWRGRTIYGPALVPEPVPSLFGTDLPAGWNLKAVTGNRVLPERISDVKLLERLIDLYSRLKEGDPNALPLIRRLIHSPLVELLVDGTPNKVDDIVLEFLRGIIPPL